MQSLTRMLVIAMLCLGASLAFAGEMESSTEPMQDDDMMAEKPMKKGMEKDDMAGDMDHGMKEGTMDSMDDTEETSDTESMPMEDDTMSKDTME